jgi:Uma2 family endonuclease
MAMPLVLRRFTVDEYQRMGEAGVFHEDDRVELLDGRIVEMTPIGSEHAGCVKQLCQLLYAAAGRAITVGVQDPLVLGTYSTPQPDIAVLKPRPEGYRKRHPHADDCFLVVEVADTSVASDRSDKVPLYAHAGIPEVWLVNLPAGSIEVYRTPQAGRFTDVRTARRGETLTPLRLPAVALSVDDILG